VFVLALAEGSIQLVPDGTLILHFLIILIMVGVLNATLFRPINRILAERELKTSGRLSEAQSTLAQVRDKLATYERELREARAESYRLSEQERLKALQDREAQIAVVKEETAVWISREKANLAQQSARAQADLKVQARSIAVEIGSRVLRRRISDAANLDIT
jgi:F-type H+-transporting ATPase subunit b